MKQLKQALFLGLLVILSVFSTTASAKSFAFWERSDEGFYTFLYEDYKGSRFAVATKTSWDQSDDQSRHWHVSGVICPSLKTQGQMEVDGMLLRDGSDYRMITYDNWVIKNPVFSKALDPDLKGAYQEYCAKKQYHNPQHRKHRDFMGY